MAELAERVGGKNSHHFKFVQVPFNIMDCELFIEDECQYLPDSDKTDSLLKVAESLGLNVLTGGSLKGGSLCKAPRIKGNYSRDPVSSLLQFYKSINSESRSPNWAGAAFNSNNLLHFQKDLDFLRLPPMAESDVRSIWNINNLKIRHQKEPAIPKKSKRI